MQALRRWVTPLWFLLVVLAAIPCGLWLGSGREILTKSSRAVEVNVTDDVFGDSTSETRFEHGPIFGYYVGLDAVTAAASLFLTVLAFSVLLRRMRQRNRGAPVSE